MFCKLSNALNPFLEEGEIELINLKMFLLKDHSGLPRLSTRGKIILSLYQEKVALLHYLMGKSSSLLLFI